MTTVTRPFQLVIDDGSAVPAPIRSFATLPAAVAAMFKLSSAQQRYTWITERRGEGYLPVVHVRDGKPATEWAEVAMR